MLFEKTRIRRNLKKNPGTIHVTSDRMSVFAYNPQTDTLVEFQSNFKHVRDDSLQIYAQFATSY